MVRQAMLSLNKVKKAQHNSESLEAVQGSGRRRLWNWIANFAPGLRQG